jgi:DNA modification methylase
MESNTLYYGDNLAVLREHFPDTCVDLIYLDPPFNSNRSYNVLFKETATTGSPAQIEAFGDTWHWGNAAQHAFEEVALHGSDNTARLLKAMVDALGHNDMTAYLTMMAVRLVELHRVLKPTGSIYLHCDPTAGPYLRVLMDSVFGAIALNNEIVWQRTSAHADARQGARHYGRISDLLLFYTKSQDFTWNTQYTAHDEDYIRVHYPYTEATTGRRYGLWDITGPGGAAKGNPLYEVLGITKYWRYSRATMEQKIREGKVVQPRPGAVPREIRYLDESLGTPVGAIWTDIPPINSQAKERLGYPTQEPLALLERIINASSNPGDMVLDPFCGCGTAVHAAQNLGRQWAGIDITYLAIGLIGQRMRDAFPGITINEIGVPADLPGAQALAAHDPYQFQFWAVHQLGGAPVGGQNKRGADSGIDGIIPFIEGATERRRVMISVKAGNLQPAFVRELKGVLERECESIGVLVTLREPTSAMQTEAVSAGSYHSDFWNRDYPRIQLITAAELLAGRRVEMPPQVSPFSQAARETERGEQTNLI